MLTERRLFQKYLRNMGMSAQRREHRVGDRLTRSLPALIGKGCGIQLHFTEDTIDDMGE